MPALFLVAAFAAAEEEPVIITATRISEDVAKVPSSVTVIGGDELRQRGAKDLGDALALASGVDIARGGDSGPAGSVPEFWGLKEFDAFLLVVDGVPWGGAFNPALVSADLHDVERIEVMRGAAPVMYGATSFVGVIHIIHKSPEKTERTVRTFAGNHASRGVGLSLPLPALGDWKSAAGIDFEKQGVQDPRASFDKDRFSLRSQGYTPLGRLSLAAEASLLSQDPISPILREGAALSRQIPLDANHNPAGAFLDEDRFSLSAKLESKLAQADWTTLVSYSHNAQRIFRGFLNDITVALNSRGFRETIGVTDLYFDSHLKLEPVEVVKLVGGVDHLHGRGTGRGGGFDYFVALNGAGAPSAGLLTSDSDARITDQRDFSGLYGFAEWEPLPQLLVEAGGRLNHTDETRQASSLDMKTNALTGGVEHVRLWHGSGSAGTTWTPWRSGKDLAALFLAYKNNFKPAAADFGITSDFHALAPETAESFEAGVKTRLFDDKLDFDASAFHVNFHNLLAPITTAAGNPAKANAGATHLRGLELESSAELAEHLRLRASYSLHDSRFADYTQTFGGVPTQLSGKRMEMFARNMWAAGLTYAPPTGFNATTQLNTVGRRFLNKRNTAEVRAFTTWSAGLGYRVSGWEFRLDGRNLNNRRPPVAESELGDAQYYIMPGRRFDISASWTF